VTWNCVSPCVVARTFFFSDLSWTASLAIVRREYYCCVSALPAPAKELSVSPLAKLLYVVLAAHAVMRESWFVWVGFPVLCAPAESAYSASGKSTFFRVAAPLPVCGEQDDSYLLLLTV
jgi:hypothetical protein